MKEKASTSTNDTQVLKTVLFKYLQLHEELQSQSSELTQQIKQQTKENKQLIHVFKENLKELSQLEENLGEYSQERVMRTLQMVSQQLKQELEATIADHLGQYVRGLVSQIHKIKELVEKAEAVLTAEYWQERLMTLVMAVLSSVFVCWLVMPHPTLPLTQEQIDDTRVGHKLRQSADRLSEATKRELRTNSNIYWLDLEPTFK